MLSEAAENFKRAPKIAIVLGGHGVGDIIYEGLSQMGFQASFAPSDIQRFSSIGWVGSSPDDLRKTLRVWIDEQKAAHPDASLWIHPGITPWAERPELPTLGQELGIQMISPPSRVLSLFGNRLTLLGEAEKISIPNLSLSQNPLHSVREIERLINAQKIKLPFVLKAVRGGSGYGIRVIHHPEDLGRSLALWLEQLQRNVGEVILLAEKYLEGARRIVQPFARFSNGDTEFFPTMDVSLTCRFRKLIEFCPALENADQVSLKKIKEWTEALIHRTNYVGVGSLEYLVDGDRSYLIEGIPRLNTSFPIWQNVMGTSAIAWQIATLFGKPDLVLPAAPKREWKSALSLRFYAEDPILQLPQPGVLAEISEAREWNFPGTQARFTPSVEAGYELLGDPPPEKRNPLQSQFGGLIGHLWVGAEDPKRALTVARGVLDQIWMAGSLQTNEHFLQELLSHPWIQEGMFHASFIDEEFIPPVRPSPEILTLFLALAQMAATPVSPSTAVKWVVGDQWMKPLAQNPEIEWKDGPHFFEVEKHRGVSGTFVFNQSKTFRVLCYPILDEKWLIRVGNWVFAVRRVISQASAKTSGAKPLPKLNALVSGRIHSILFREGSWVQAHDTVLVIESLGSLIPHALPVDVKIMRWVAAQQAQVVAGQVLAELETSVRNE